MTNGDRALERIIAELTAAIAMTADARLVTLKERAQRYLQIRMVTETRPSPPNTQDMNRYG